MIFHRLSDRQARQAGTVVIAAVPVTVFLATQLANGNGAGVAVGFASLMTILLAMIGVQIAQSKRLNAVERGTIDG